MSVRGALLCERRRLIRRHVLPPLRRLLRRAGADVDGDIGVRADLLQEIHELVRAEGVRFDHAAPIWVQRRGSLFSRPDALAPVILVRKASARPANVRDAQRLERRYDVITDARSEEHTSELQSR